MMAAIVIVRPQPIALAKGKTKAEAAAENRYLTTEVQLTSCEGRSGHTIVDGDDFS